MKKNAAHIAGEYLESALSIMSVKSYMSHYIIITIPPFYIPRPFVCEDRTIGSIARLEMTISGPDPETIWNRRSLEARYGNCAGIVTELWQVRDIFVIGS